MVFKVPWGGGGGGGGGGVFRREGDGNSLVKTSFKYFKLFDKEINLMFS